MFASSSPPNVSRVRHGPRSSATTRTPRSVRTLAAAAPDAPAPMMQTSARSGMRLAATSVLLSGVYRMFGEILQRAVAAAVNLGQRGRPRKPDDVPTDAVVVAAVDRVGVEALPGVQREQGHEVELDLGARLLERDLHGRAVELHPCALELGGLLRLVAGSLERLQHVVLLVSGELGEVRAEALTGRPVERLDARDVALADDLDAPLPGLRALAVQPLEPAAVGFGVDEAEAGQVTVEELDRACLAGAGRVVGGDDPRHRGLDRRALVRVEERLLAHARCSSLSSCSSRARLARAPAPGSPFQPSVSTVTQPSKPVSRRTCRTPPTSSTPWPSGTKAPPASRSLMCT